MAGHSMHVTAKVGNQVEALEIKHELIEYLWPGLDDAQLAEGLILWIKQKAYEQLASQIVGGALQEAKDSVDAWTQTGS